MAIHSSILPWKNPMGRGAWQATVTWGHKESDTTEHTHTHTYTSWMGNTKKFSIF